MIFTDVKIRFLRGTTQEANNYVGAEGEVTVDKQKKRLRLHDGSTQGGTEIAATEDVKFPNIVRYDVESRSQGGSGTITFNLAEQQVFRHSVGNDRTFAFSNPPGSGRAMTVILHLYNSSLSNRTINWPSGIVWQGGNPPIFRGTSATVVLLWTGEEWVGSLAVDNG